MGIVRSVAAALLLAAVCAAPAAGAAGSGSELLREILRQQSSARDSACAAVRAAVGTESPEEVVRVAIGLGFPACEVVRCAIAAGAPLAKVLEGAAAAGTPAEVLSRCAVESGEDPAAVAALLNDLLLEPSLCYFDPGLRGAAPVVPPYGDRDRQYQRTELSPFVP